MIPAVFWKLSEGLPPKAGRWAFSAGPRLLLGSPFNTAFQRQACICHGLSLQAGLGVLRLREDESGLGQSRLLTHLRPQHIQIRPAEAIKKPGLSSRRLSHPSGGPGASHRANVLQNPLSAQWRGQSLSWGQERTYAATSSKKTVAAGQGQNVSSSSRAQGSETEQPGSGIWLGPSLNTHFPTCKMGYRTSMEDST